MAEFEMEVQITIKGYESISAESKEVAIRFMQKMLDERFTFNAPLSQKSAEFKIKAKERRRES